MTIFVSIAAYRDPQLEPTLRDCVANARYPRDLRFGICWQHTDDEPMPSAFSDLDCRVIDVPWHATRGACWARAEIMRLWNGEDFFLQLDSHHRFMENWDAILMAEAEISGVTLPLLSTYCAAFDPHIESRSASCPVRMDIERFSDDGIPLFVPHVVADWPESRPMRARFVSAHFLFAPGRFVADVPYDPALYFHGEEITLAVRAFTHGYTLLHPARHVLWHEYTRNYRAKHWDDHLRERGVPLAWYERDAVSRGKVQNFLTNPDVGPFGCGTARSFAEYEAYAGLNFRERTATEPAQRGEEPPIAPTPLEDGAEVRTWELRIAFDRSNLPLAAFENPQFWYVGFHDAAGAELYREDACGAELVGLVDASGKQVVIERRFRSARQPVTWTVWPCNAADGGWLRKQQGRAESVMA